MTMTTFCADPQFFGLVAGGIAMVGGLCGAWIGRQSMRPLLDRFVQLTSEKDRDLFICRTDLRLADEAIARLSRWERKQCPKCLRFAAADHVCKPQKLHEWPAELPDPETFGKKQVLHLEPTGDLVEGQPVCARIYYDRIRLRTKGGTRWIWRRRVG